MNRDQRRVAGKGQSKQRLVLSGITAFFDNGQRTNLDVSKIQIVDRQTLRPIFEEVLEPQPKQVTEGKPAYPADDPHPGDASTDAYTVEFDTPEGRMQFVKNGNWSGVKKVI